jgi:ABC-type uncharacterized transport system permease subunit
MDDAVPFGGRAYLGFVGLLAFARGADLLSTWVASPNLVLEGNPLAKWLRWRGNLALSMAVSLGFALWPLPAVIIATTSVLVAARNFQQAWLMRSLGEQPYRLWHMARLQDARMALYLLCLAGQTALTAAVGAALIYFSPGGDVPMGIGIGIVGYAGAVAFYTLLSVWRMRRAMG